MVKHIPKKYDYSPKEHKAAIERVIRQAELWGYVGKEKSMKYIHSKIKKMNNRKPMVSEGILLASIPIFAYFITYCYEYGYTKVYQIPIEFIKPTYTTIFIVMGIFGFTMLNVLVLINPILLLLPYNQKITRRIRIFTPISIVFITYLFLFKAEWKEWIVFPAIIIVFLFFELVFPIISQRKIKGYKNKLKANNEFDSKNPSLFNRILNLGGGKLINYILITAYIFIIAYGAGRANALYKTEYLLISEGQKCIVLRIYGDNLITVPFSIENFTYKNEYLIRNINNEKIVMKLEKTGVISSE